MLGRNVGEAILHRGPDYVWGSMRSALLRPDLLMMNLECVIASDGAPVADKTFHFRAPPEAAGALISAGADVVTLANNHSLDYGPHALSEMLELLDTHGIRHVGAGRNAAEAWRPAFVKSQGVCVGIVAFTDNEPGWAASANRPGVAHAPIDVDSPAYPHLLEALDSASAQCDVLVASAHWGPNMRRTPPERFQRFARGLVDAGVDLFWGHSAHLFQGIERRGRGVILYDTGDFVNDYRVDENERNDIGFLFEAQVGADATIGDIALRPVMIDAPRCQVNAAPDAEAEWAAERMAALSRAFGTRVESGAHGLHVGRHGSAAGAELLRR